MLIHSLLENSAARFPDKLALIHEKTRATYRQVNADADRLASFLVGQGVDKGDRVVILLENGYEYVIAYYAILKAGAVVVPLSTDLKPDGLNPLLAELKPAAIISSARFERLLQASDLHVPNLKTLILNQSKQNWDNHRISTFSFQQTTNPKPQPVGVVVSFRQTTNHPQQTTHNKQPTTNDKPQTSSRRDSNAEIGTEDISVTESDLGSIIYTSGSTGKPKGVILTHGNIVANVNAICQYLQLTENDIQMVVLPFFYVMGKSLLNTVIAAGGTLVINNKFAFPATVISQMIEEDVTLFSGVPSTYAYLLHRSPLKKSKDQLKQLRMVTQAGGHMARSVKAALRESLPEHTKICIMYGATEASARLSWLDPEHFEQKIDSIGRAIPGVTVKILDEQGVEVAQGAKGEVVANGPNIMQGYWKDPESTAKALDENGYHTGDVGWKDEEGFIFLEGRKDNLLKVGGHRINPQEVEDALLATQLAVEAAVVGLSDDLLGKRLAALVVPLNGDTSPEEIKEKCSTILPKYKLPGEIRLVRSLPKNANGKVDLNGCLEVVGRRL